MPPTGNPFGGNRCGEDYGWNTFEGSRCLNSCSGVSRSGYTFPFFEYCHPDYDSKAAGESVFTDGKDICGSRAVEGLAVICE